MIISQRFGVIYQKRLLNKGDVMTFALLILHQDSKLATVGVHLELNQGLNQGNDFIAELILSRG